MMIATNGFIFKSVTNSHALPPSCVPPRPQLSGLLFLSSINKYVFLNVISLVVYILFSDKKFDVAGPGSLVCQFNRRVTNI